MSLERYSRKTPIAEKRRMSMDLHEMRLANGTDMKRTDIEGTNRQIYSCLKRGPKAKGEQSFDPLVRCPDRTPNLYGPMQIGGVSSSSPVSWSKGRVRLNIAHPQCRPLENPVPAADHCF